MTVNVQRKKNKVTTKVKDERLIINGRGTRQVVSLLNAFFFLSFFKCLCVLIFCTLELLYIF